jgi:hypothetical protein
MGIVDMKTPEDEAFEDIERRQGGGFPAKRAMAADKVQEPEAEQFKFWSVTGKYERQAFASLASAEAYCKGLNTTHPEGNYVVRPLQEITKACTDERMCVPCYTGQGTCETTLPAHQSAQPAQEPVAWTLLLTDEHHGIIGKAGEKFIGAPECYQRVDVYTIPPKREWVGLTEEETSGFTQHEMTVVKYVSKVLQEKNT